MSVVTDGPARRRLEAALRSAGCRSTSGRSSWTCPAHDDARPSLSVRQGRGGVLVKCHAGCSTEAVVTAIGLSLGDLFDEPRAPSSHGLRREPETVHSYHDEHGDLLFEAVRFAGKRFRQRRPDPDQPGRYVWGIKGVRRVLYRLPELLEAVLSGLTIYIVEGEKDADALANAGEVATCNPMGAGSWKQVEHHAREVLAGTTVVVVADKDEVGRAHAREVAESLQPVVAVLTIVEALDGKDAADHLAAGHAVQDFAPAEQQADAPSASHSGGSGLPGSSCQLPIIHCGEDLAEQVRAAEEVLAKRRDVFQRGGSLVRLVRDRPPPPGLRRPAGSPWLIPLSRAHARELASEGARWERLTGRGRWVRCLPPDPMVAALLTRGEWPTVRPAEGIVESPVLRQDGTLLTEVGWDPETHLIHEPAGRMPEVPRRPDQAAVAQALDDLMEVVSDFPFADDVHRAGWLAALLTPMARFAFGGPSPLFLFEGNVNGVGKGLLARVLGIIATGRAMPIMSLPRSDEEMDKRITSLALAGDPLVLIDNIDGELRCPSLDAALTAPETWQGRILGRSKMSASLPLNMTWYATGNNVSLSSDTADRVVHIRLESPLERPRDRSETDFKHPRLPQWVAENRPRLLGSALTLLVGYWCAGRPPQELRPWGSFEEWSDVVRGTVVWAGLPDPAGARDAFHDAAVHEAATIARLLCAWQELAGERGLTIARALQAADSPSRRDSPEARLGEALRELSARTDGDLPSARELGRHFRRLRGRTVSGRRLTGLSKGRDGVSWLVEDTGPISSSPLPVTQVTEVTRHLPDPPSRAMTVGPVQESLTSLESPTADRSVKGNDR